MTKIVGIGLTATVSVAALIILISTIGIISSRSAVLFFFGILAVGVALLVLGKPIFYSARSTRK